MQSGVKQSRFERRFVALLLGAVYVLGVVYGVLVLVLRPPPPPQVPSPQARPALSKHVLLLIVDGLRYDVATDPDAMPRFAEAMHQHRSAEIFAGPISMTSAAIQNYGTGQRGRFAQIVRNINPDPPAFNSWLANAAARGRRLALAGDPAWIEMYGASFSDKRLDPEGVAMDYDFNDRTFASTRELHAKSPDFLVAHFVTPDHQGHVYGIPSARYRKHIHDFDGRLFQLLAEFENDWTVIVTSDHGAADSGTHGADVRVQRRSPIFAYGPGIAPPGEPETLDQSDLAGTLAALLGVPAAAHSQGHLLSSWLAVSPELGADYACSDAERALTLLRAEEPARAPALAASLASGCARERGAEQRRRAAASVVREVDTILTTAQGYLSFKGCVFLATVLLGASLVAWLLVGRAVAVAVVLGVLGASAVALVAGLEHLPGYWPKTIDGALFVLFNLPSLLFLLKPERLIALLDRYSVLAAAIVPGGFAVAYPTNLEPVAFSICLVAPLVILLGQRADSWGVSFRRGETAARLVNIGLIAAWGAALAPAGISASGAYSTLAARELLTFGLGLLLIGLVAWVLLRPSGADRYRRLAGFMLLAAASLWLRRWAPVWLGRPLLIGLPILGAWLVARRRFELGFWLVFCGYLWVSRDFEVLPVTGGLGITLMLGERFGSMPEGAWSRGRWLIAVGVLFCVMFLVRLGVSAGLDALSLDFGAGAFRDKHVPAWWIASAVIWKYLLIALLLIAAYLRRVPGAVAERSVVALIALSVCRAAVLLGMMQLANGSFWTSMRVISDLPFALLFAVAAAAALPWASRVEASLRA